jgi:hypothetical protein
MAGDSFANRHRCMPNAMYYRKQAQVFAEVAAQTSSPLIAVHYTNLANSYLARAAQLEAETDAVPQDREKR